MSHFEGLIHSHDYKKAALEAGSDPGAQQALAAALLVQAIEKGIDINGNIDVLVSAGSMGKQALKRLCRNAAPPASHHACIARMWRCLPRKATLDQYLKSDYGDVRGRAARKWAHKFDKKTLLSLLEDIEPKVRRASVEALRQHDDPEVSASLRNTLLRDPVPIVRSAAAKSGPALGPEALLALKSALRDENLGVRLAALQGLAEIPSPAAADILENTAHGPIDELAATAIMELLRRGDEKAKPRLEALLANNRAVIRKMTLLRLAGSGVKNRETLLKKALQDTTEEVAILAADLLSKYKNGLSDGKATLRKIAAGPTLEAAPARDLLATLGDEKAIAEVKKRLFVGGKAEILTTLKRTARCPELASSFTRLMGHETEKIRLEAARATLRALTHKS